MTHIRTINIRRGTPAGKISRVHQRCVKLGETSGSFLLRGAEDIPYGLGVPDIGYEFDERFGEDCGKAAGE